MQEYYKISGNYPIYNDISLSLHRNHTNYFTFRWEDFFRTYRYIPDIDTFNFRMIFTLNGKLNCDDNVLAILSSDMGEITTKIDTDKNEEFIICKLNSYNTIKLRSYDDGIFTFDYKLKSETKKDTFMIGTYDYEILFSGNWSVATNTMEIDPVNGDNIDSYLNYNVDGSDKIISGFTYDTIDPNPEPEPEYQPKTKEELEELNCKNCSFNIKCPIYNDPLFPENRVLYTFSEGVDPTYISDKPGGKPDGLKPTFVYCANDYKSYQNWKNKKKSPFDDLTYLNTEDED